jgi:hypothetical protein
MLGKHSMSMPQVKSPARSFETISAEDDDISGLRCSILSQRLPFDGTSPEPPAPKKFVRRSYSPEVDFSACSLSDPDTEQPVPTTSTAVTDQRILASKERFNAMFSSPDRPAQSGKSKGGSEQTKTPIPAAKPPPPRGGMKMFASSMSSIQMKKVILRTIIMLLFYSILRPSLPFRITCAQPRSVQRWQALTDAEEDDSPLDARAGLRANMGTILEDLDEGDPNFPRVAKYMQVRGAAPGAAARFRAVTAPTIPGEPASSSVAAASPSPNTHSQTNH